MSSKASMDTSPATAAWLMTRTKPSRSDGSEAAGNIGTVCPAASTFAGAVDRFVRWPVKGSAMRFMTRIGLSDSTNSCHLPVPSPSPSGLPTDSNSEASSVVEARARMETRASPPGDSPASSVPVIVTSAGSSPGLIIRSRLIWLRLLPGLKMATRRRPSSPAAARSCIEVRNPSEGVRI